MMPQLSPINWLFLFVMFWLVVLLAVCLLWWMMVVKFSFVSLGIEKSGDLREGVWMFYNEGGSGVALEGKAKEIG